MDLSYDNQADVVEAFDSSSRYLDAFLIINPYFEQMVSQIYPIELELNKANSFDTEAPFWIVYKSITNGKVCSNCSRCCCCLLLYDRQRMDTLLLTSVRLPGLYHRS